MKLLKVEIHGYRRFKKPSIMNVDGKLIALVGPNEAGKSSFLKALEHLNTFDDFNSAGASRELTRGVDVPAGQNIVTATFLLEDSDKKAIEHIPEARKARWLKVSKRTKGQPHYVEVIPRTSRNLAPRYEVLNDLKSLIASPGFTRTFEDKSRQSIRSLVTSLETEDQTLPAEVIRKLKDISNLFEALPQNTKKVLSSLSERASQLADAESESSARMILFARRPQFLFFSEEARLLKSEYSLDEVGDAPSEALRNFLRLANLDLKRLRDAVAARDLGEVEYLEEQANASLKDILRTTWSQAGITVRVEE